MANSVYKEQEIQVANVGGLNTACLDRRELVNLICNKIESFDEGIREYVISSTNGHSVSLYNRESRTKELIDDVDLLHADGQSIVTMSKYFSKYKIPERSATTDMFTDIPQLSERHVKHFLLGGKRDTVEKCAEIMSDRYNNFCVGGTIDGYFEDTETDKIIELINNSHSDILWVGLGKPKEQEFVFKYRAQLKVPVIITCGGCFNYVTGEYKRAPQWMQKLGLEWLHRACTEPKKLLVRYLTTNPHAIYCGIKNFNK